MDILRCKTPNMIRKELVMHLIVYNCIRQLMLTAAKQSNQPVRQISFKASVQAIRQWEPHLNQVQLNHALRLELMDKLYEVIADKKILERPGRQEPRAVKRRPKPFRLMTVPRHEMQDIQNNEKNHAKAA